VGTREFFQTIFPFLKPGEGEITKGGARVINLKTAEGLEIQQEKRAKFKATAPAAPRLIRKDLGMPVGDTRWRPGDPVGLRGPGGERIQG